jgi:hypothetical protein
LNHKSGSFGLISDSYGRIVNANATPGSYVPPGCHYMPAPMPYFMEFQKSVGMHAGYLPGYRLRVHRSYPNWHCLDERA